MAGIVCRIQATWNSTSALRTLSISSNDGLQILGGVVQSQGIMECSISIEDSFHIKISVSTESSSEMLQTSSLKVIYPKTKPSTSHDS